MLCMPTPVEGPHYRFMTDGLARGSGRDSSMSQSQSSITTICARFCDEQGLTPPLYAVRSERKLSRKGEGGSERSTSTSTSIKETTSNRSNKKLRKKERRYFPSSISLTPSKSPMPLVDCDQLLREYWSVKKGTRSESVWKPHLQQVGRLDTLRPSQGDLKPPSTVG